MGILEHPGMPRGGWNVFCAVWPAWNSPFSWWNSGESLTFRMQKKRCILQQNMWFWNIGYKVISGGEWSPILMAFGPLITTVTPKTKATPLTYGRCGSPNAVTLPSEWCEVLNWQTSWFPCLTLKEFRNWCLFNGRFQIFVNSFIFPSSNLYPTAFTGAFVELPVGPGGSLLRHYRNAWDGWRWLTYVDFRIWNMKLRVWRILLYKMWWRVNSNWSWWVTIITLRYNESRLEYSECISHRIQYLHGVSSESFLFIGSC